MNHKFLASPNSGVLTCLICTRTRNVHEGLSCCESCGKDDVCNVYKTVLMCSECESNSRLGLPTTTRVIKTDIQSCDACGGLLPLTSHEDMMLCNACNTKAQHGDILISTASIARTEEPQENILSTVERLNNELQTITYNGDFFNAKVMAIIEIEKSVMADDNIAADKKLYHFQELMLQKYLHNKEHIFELDKNKHDTVVENLAITKTLRDLGNDYRKEIQEQIKALDIKYEPAPQKAVKPRLVKEKESPVDRIIKSVMAATGKSFTEAKLIVEGQTNLKRQDD